MSKAMSIAQFDPNNLFVGPPEKNEKTGQMSAPFSLTCNAFGPNNWIRLQFGPSPKMMLSVPFGYGKLQPGADPLRLTMEVRPDAEMEAKMRALDDFVAAYVNANATSLFKTAQCNKAHCPCIVEKDSGVMARFKVVKPGSIAKPTKVIRMSDDLSKMWSSDADIMTADAKVMVVASTPGIWWNAAQYGVSFKAEELVILPKREVASHEKFSGLEGVSFVDSGDCDRMDDE
jgi:hypothetical protein